MKICNVKKLNSRRCQEQLDRAVFCIFLRSMKEWFYTVGTVLQLNHSTRDGDGMTIYCSQLGRESKVVFRSQETEGDEGNENKVELFMNLTLKNGCFFWLFQKSGCAPDVRWLVFFG